MRSYRVEYKIQLFRNGEFVDVGSGDLIFVPEPPDEAVLEQGRITPGKLIDFWAKARLHNDPCSIAIVALRALDREVSRIKLQTPTLAGHVVRCVPTSIVPTEVDIDDAQFIPGQVIIRDKDVYAIARSQTSYGSGFVDIGHYFEKITDACEYAQKNARESGKPHYVVKRDQYTNMELSCGFFTPLARYDSRGHLR